MRGLDRIPARLRKSISFDQGSEWAGWETIADTFRIGVYFCDPHSATIGWTVSVGRGRIG